jgi:hypothetical protein
MIIRCMVEDRCCFDCNGELHGKMKAGTCDFDCSRRGDLEDRQWCSTEIDNVGSLR